MWITIKQQFFKFRFMLLDWLGWLKLILQSLAVIYGVLFTVDVTKILTGEHPATVFLLWLLCLGNPLIIFIIIQIVLLLIAIIEKATMKSYSKLIKQLADKEEKLKILNNNMKELFDGLLMSFANAELAFGTGKQNQERISLYLVKKDNNNNIDYLYPFGRYSSNPKFRNTRRRKYNIDKGCIGEAYKNDYCYDGNITRNTCLNKYSYSNNEYNSMRMKTKTIAAMALKDKSNRVIGVLVAESQEQNWQKTQIRKKLEKQVNYYSEICCIFKDYIDDKVDSNINKGDMPW